MHGQRVQGWVLLVATAALLVAAPSPAAALMSLAHPAADDPFGPLVAAAALLAWLLAGWLLLTTAALTAERAPGAIGRAGARVARRVAPLAVRRLVAVTLGLTVATSALAGTAASASPGLPPAPPPAGSLDWPSAAQSPATPVTPAAPRAPAAPAAGAAASALERPAETVVVQPGDSLWAIAAAHLPAGAPPARVAAAWPSWWATNRAVVGDDPGLIQPGQHLVPPVQP